LFETNQGATVMTVNIPTHFVEQYTSNVAHLLQIKGGKLRATVNEGTHEGDAAVPLDQYGAVEMQEVTSRFGPMGRVDAAPIVTGKQNG
jgi:autonomous glycyl radical cofactor GrcA